jgi:hypothetical protein
MVDLNILSRCRTPEMNFHVVETKADSLPSPKKLGMKKKLMERSTMNFIEEPTSNLSSMHSINKTEFSSNNALMHLAEPNCLLFVTSNEAIICQ